MDEKILQMLYAGEWISGESISRELGVTRAAVAKRISNLRQQGYVIDAVPRRGYHLVSAPEKLFGFEVSRKLKRDVNWHIETFDELDSTNTYLRNRGDELPEYSVAIARRQTGGLGRLGREWYSPVDDALYMSLLLHPDLPPDRAQLLTLTSAVSVAEAIREQGLECYIKWPNDILTPQRRKLVGIRCEMRADLDRVYWLVVGIGVNVNNQDFPPELSGVASSLRLLNGGTPLELSDVAAAILDRFADNYRLLCEDRFDLIRQNWTNMALAINEEASISGLQGKETGIVRGLDEEGYLLLEQNGRLNRVLAGDMVIAHQEQSL